MKYSERVLELNRRLIITESTGDHVWLWQASNGKWYSGYEHRRNDPKSVKYYGPFKDEDDAIDKIGNKFGNPGSYSFGEKGQPPPKNAIKIPSSSWDSD